MWLGTLLILIGVSFELKYFFSLINRNITTFIDLAFEFQERKVEIRVWRVFPKKKKIVCFVAAS